MSLLRRQPAHRSAARRPGVESLEPRLALSSSGVLWGSAPHLTVSFAPDGTAIGSRSSQLASRFDQLATTAEWQNAILQAFQTWTQHTNGDVGLVADDGSPLGTPGAAQRDARFGDVRIGGAALSPEVLAVAVPHDLAVGGTWGGEVLFNTAANWTSLADVFAVAVHEAGHVLGLAHSADPASPMHVHGVTPVISPTPTDLANLQTLHGQRAGDRYETPLDNNTQAQATKIQHDHPDGFDTGQTPLVAHGDITTASDVDWFYLEPIDEEGTVTFRLRTDGISLLAPQLSVYRATGQLVQTAAATGERGGRVQITVPALETENYYVEVRAASAGLAGIGGYALTTTQDQELLTPASVIEVATSGVNRLLSQGQMQKRFEPARAQIFDDDLHSDDTFVDPPTPKTTPGYVEDTHFYVLRSISDRTDVDTYEFKSADVPQAQNVMTVLIHSLEAGGLIPKVEVFDRDEVPLPFTIIANDGGDVIVQLTNVERRKTHFVRVSAADASGPFATGNYSLTVLAGVPAASLVQFATGAVGGTNPAQSVTSLYVAETQLFHLALETTTAAPNGSTLVLATLRNEEGEVVLQTATAPGGTRTTPSTLLLPGTYSLQVAALGLGGTAGAVNYRILGQTISQPTGPGLNDPTGDPAFECPGNPGTFCYPGGVTSTDPYLWGQFLSSLPEIPALTGSDLLSRYLADWWSWLWNVNAATNVIPSAQNDRYSATTNDTLSTSTPIGVLSNDLDPDGRVLATAVVDPPQHGTLALRFDGTFIYTPNPGYLGGDQFTYRVSDYLHSSNVASVQIDVVATPLPTADINRDGRVDIRDLALLQGNFGATSTGDELLGDVNGDLAVDRVDLVMLTQQLGTDVRNTPPPSPPAAVVASAPRTLSSTVRPLTARQIRVTPIVATTRALQPAPPRSSTGAPHLLVPRRAPRAKLPGNGLAGE